jgi:threonine/homoserine/homoserine lactone efflux protein
MMLLGEWQALGFLGAAILITLSPGPDNLMVLGLGMSRGRRQGMVFGLGCALGCLNHTLLAVLGISALIAASDWAFLGLKLCGGLYLLWLGVQAIRSTGGVAPTRGGDDSAVEPLWPLFLRGLVANAINPKVVLFFLAFLPQFVQPERGDVVWQTAQLGVVFTLQGMVLFGAIGYFSGWLGRRLARSPGMGRWLDRLAGMVFIGLGLKLMASP